MISVKILDKMNYFEFIGVDSKILKCRGYFRWRLRMPSSAVPRNEQNETIGFGLAFHWLRTHKLKSTWLNKNESINKCFTSPHSGN